jgi:hypothetical protein
VEVSIVTTHKNATLATLNAVANGNDITVFTDNDCSISWSVAGAF